MRNLFKLLWMFLVAAVVWSCANEDLEMPQETAPGKTTTKITLEEAQQDLMKLLGDLDKVRSRSEGKLPRTIKEAYSVTLNPEKSRSDENPEIHVFNFDNEQGFALMSGDERIPSLLALADSGSYNGNYPPVKFLTDSVKKYVITPVEPGVGCIDWGDTIYRRYNDWENLAVYKNSAYCKVKWSQDAPYNRYCGNGEYVYTGCVTTAIAQLMSVYKYPQSYNSYEFDWNAMTENPHAYFCSSQGEDQIAALMSFLSEPSNLNIDYKNGQGNAYLSDVKRTFKAFQYSKGGDIRDYKTGLVVSEIQSGYPVLASGRGKYFDEQQNKDIEEGHMWLIHGLLVRSRVVEIRDIKTKALIKTELEYADYPLCNWGKGGLNDGYYLSGSFMPGPCGPDFEEDLTRPEYDPKKTKHNYSAEQKIIINIRK